MFRVVITLIFALLVSVVSGGAIAKNWNMSQKLEHNPRGKIPNSYKGLPLETARFYFQAYNRRGAANYFYNTSPSSTPRKIETALKGSAYVTAQVAETSLVSYMVYDKGKLLVSELSPRERLGDLINEHTLLYSMSLGKNLAGYMIGHAICQGYIESIEQSLSDWPLVADTFIADLTVRDVINATMGNHSFMKKGDMDSFKSGNRVDHSLKDMIFSDLKGTKAGTKVYQYGQLSQIIALNYIAFKTGYKFLDFSNSVLRDHVHLADTLLLDHASVGQETHGIIHGNFKATRGDTLRIGIAILEDWNKNNCVGKFLKDVYANGVKKNPSQLSSSIGTRVKDTGWGYSREYAGFFHTKYKTVDANVMGMDGYGGISMLINFDDNRIVYAHAVNRDYDHRKLIFKVIKGEEDLTNLLGLTKGKTQKTIINDKAPSRYQYKGPSRDLYQSYSDKQVCTMVGALNGLAEQKLWIEEARQRGLSQCK